MALLFAAIEKTFRNRGAIWPYLAGVPLGTSHRQLQGPAKLPTDWDANVGVTRVNGSIVYFQPPETGFAQGIVAFNADRTSVRLRRLSTTAVPIVTAAGVSSAMLAPMPLWVRPLAALGFVIVMGIAAFGQRKRVDDAFQLLLKQL